MQAGISKLILIYLALLAAFIGYPPSLLANSHQDFNTICEIFTESENSSFTNEQKSDYIDDNVKKRITSKDALQAYSAMFQLDSGSRYDIFKKSAEYSTKHKWECAVMKKVMSKAVSAR